MGQRNVTLEMAQAELARVRVALTAARSEKERLEKQLAEAEGRVLLWSALQEMARWVLEAMGGEAELEREEKRGQRGE